MTSIIASTMEEVSAIAQIWTAADQATRPGRQKRPFKPPRLTINLSHAPTHRYDEVAMYMKQRLDLPKLFNSILDDLTGPAIAAILRIPIHLLMRRLHSDEEDAELRGISRATGVPRALLVMFNVFVDMIVGCTSGGARVTMPAHDEGDDSTYGSVEGTPAGAGCRSTSRMFHFRTLDWGGAKLRRIIIELDFVAFDGGPVVARTLTYFGYVGVLTGVRRGLSVSLNRRPWHDRSTLTRRVRYRCHQALVVFGLRPGISSLLRGLLFNNITESTIPTEDANSRSLLWRPSNCSDIEHRRMAAILQQLQAAPSTAAYLILCTPTHVYNIEKDHRSASWTSSNHFILTCNNDVAEDPEPGESLGLEPVGNKGKSHSCLSPNSSQGMKCMEWTISGSVKRKQGIMAVREGLIARRRRRDAPKHGLEDCDPPYHCGECKDRNMMPEDLLVMVKNRPMSNSQTQYAVIMDPSSGAFVWRMGYAEKPAADRSEGDR